MTTTSGNGHQKTHNLPKPHPDLSPEEVIRIVLDALQHNDSPCMDCGIEVAFNFASPTNRAVTGPLPRFAEMVHSPMYQPLVGFSRIEFEPISLDGNHAEQHIQVFDASGESAAYVWMLTRQPGPAWKDCWLTDSVIRVE